MFDEELVTWSVDGGGKFFYRPKSRYSITNVSGFLRVTTKEKLDTYYTWAHLFSIWQTMTFNYTEKLHPSILRERFSFSYPPLPEQKKTAHILSTVQRAIEAQERIMQTTTELKKVLMHKLFTEGLRNEPQKQTEIGPVPESWEESTLGILTTMHTGGTPSRKNKNYWEGGTIPWVKTGEVNYRKIKTTEESITEVGLNRSNAKLFPKGTLLMAMYGQGITRGRVGLLGIDAATNQACAAITPHDETQVSTEYLYFYLEYFYKELRSRGHGANQKNLSMTLLKLFPVMFPDSDDQKAIVKALRSVDAKIALAGVRQSSFQDLFRTLLHELMTAKTHVHELDLSE